MRRLVLLAGIVAALAAAAVAVGAAGDVRIHRLHLPPPPVIDESSSDPGVPGTTVPSDPSAPPAANPPAPPGTQPPPPAPPSGVGCTTTNAGTPADDTGTLEDYMLSLSSPTLPAAGTLRIRGVNTGADTHAIAIKPAGAAAAKICGTPNITPGQTDTFAVTNLPAGTYVIYCTIHPIEMHEDVTVG